jgi:phosphoglycolate phosphatase
MKRDSSKRIKAVIFDFDGTIADSFEIFVLSLETILKRPKPLSSQEINDSRKLSLREIIKRLEVKKWQFPLLVLKGKREISKHMDQVEVFKGMPEALEELSNAGYEIYILSTNTDNNIDNFLKKYQIKKYVKRVYADIGLRGKAKSLRKLRKREGLTNTDCIYVGDETRDIEAAQKADVKCVAVSWGYSAPEALETYKPDALVNRPADLANQVRLAL